ncbi:cysteine desulfurase-like protein [Cryobacterium sp. TMT1-62]|uniref:Cysteine desulfurase-like protein n=1 Tax=Cryobacterium sandaracinum TaxID=1259247 RepID=A0ABY2J3L3_9MICO|nr:MULTISPECIES: cysteine desulfurase-like protein [Cryobacterium]TFB57814.1 cysteine desulfurase-like protein [Cryobacterium sp. Sr3]TFB61085.1 cysteine desulfurase-like protein [Cryobacterium sp. Hz7]TFC69852.1 cysteine desulfurase-like protein [Cryobacterium sp. TMT2-4]TFC99454.1 cysteine desulfurase-like protein [Cryobacterium sandaracinum]TFD33534.1 cysteine desulfurase-like protein [Cryobacterium sp. TMT1-62]
MTFDAQTIRPSFPALATGTAFFDGPGGTQTPLAVGSAIASTLTGPLSIRGTGSTSQQNAEDAVTGFRSAMADLLGAEERGIVYGRSATQLTYDLANALSAGWGPGDEVVVTRLDHDANIRPWMQAADRAGATVRWADFDPATGELSVPDIAAVLSERTRLVAVTAASNLIGTRPPVAAIARLAHSVGALLYVDGVHYTPHASVDVAALGADFFVCSAYKFFGPHCGILASAPALLETIYPDKLVPSSDQVPERFELGTLPYETMAGVTAAVEFLAGLGDAAPAGASRRERLIRSSQALEHHEETLRGKLEAGLAELPGARLHSRAAVRTPTVLVTFTGHDTADASRHLCKQGILAPAGSFYALEASRHLGLGDRGGLRIGLAPYNTVDEVARLLAALSVFLRVT